MKKIIRRFTAGLAAAAVSVSLLAQGISASAIGLPQFPRGDDLIGPEISAALTELKSGNAALSQYSVDEEFAIVPVCAGASTLDHARSNGNLILYHIDRTATQRWKLVRQGNYYYIKSGVDGKVIGINGASCTQGQPIVLRDSNGGDNQLWRITSAGDGTFIIRSKMNDNMVVDVTGRGKNDWTQIQVYPFNASSAQRFRFVPLSTVEPESEWGASRHDCHGTDWDYWDGSTDYAWYFADRNATDYRISTAAELRGMATLALNGWSLDGKIIHLTRDINLCGIEWTPIGSLEHPLYGCSFDGGGHAIIGLSITGAGDYQGLFGRVQEGTICNLAVKGNVSGDDHVGGIVGQIEAGHLVNLYSEVTLTKGTDSYLGGIAGVINPSCYAEHLTQNARVNSYDKDKFRGGIAGSQSGVMRYCVNKGTVDCNWTYVGGITGYSQASKIEFCANYGEITGGSDTERAGGIAGQTANGAVVCGCVNYGYVHSSGDDYIGGIVGLNESNAVWACINHGDVSGREYVGGITGKNGCLYCLNRGNIGGSKYYGAICGTTNSTLICCRALAWSCQYLTGNGENGSEWISAQDIMNGKACFALNGLGAGHDYGTYNIVLKNVFRQNVGSDPYPTFSGAQVTSSSGGNSEYFVSVSAEKGYGTVTGGGTFQKGEAVTLYAEPADGCVFDHFEVRTAVIAQREMYSGSHDYVITQSKNYTEDTLLLTDSIKGAYTVYAVFKPYDDVPDDLKQRVKIELEVTDDVDGWNNERVPVYLLDSAGDRHLWEPSSADLDGDGRKVSHTFDIGAASPVAVCAYPDFGGGCTYHAFGMKARMWVNDSGTAMETGEIMIRSWPFITSLHNDDYMHFTFGNYGNSSVGTRNADGSISVKGTYSTCTEAWNAARSIGSDAMIRLESAWLPEQILELSGNEITVDLNGFPIIRSLKKTTNNGGVFKLTQGSKLHIIDSMPTRKSCSAFDGGSIQGGRSADIGALIHVEAGSKLDMVNGALYNGGTDDKGGGAIWNKGMISLSNVLIANCWAYGGRSTDNCGGAIRMDNNAYADLSKCRIRGCYAQDIGGAFMVDSGTLTLDDVTVSGCYTKENEGGALYAERGTLQISDCTFRSCSAAEDHGGAVYADNSDLTCNKVTFVGNNTEDNGGAIYVTGNTQFTLTDCSFSSNTSSDDGGAFYVNDVVEDKESTVSDCVFTGNTSDGNGGAMYINDDHIFLRNVEMTGNKAGSGKTGGAVYLDNDTFNGYAIGLQGKVVIKNNTADGKDNNLLIKNTSYITNGGLLDGSEIHLTPDANYAYMAVKEISKAQSQYLKVDSGISLMKNKKEKTERFVSSVIGEGKLVTVFVGLFLAILAVAVLIFFRKRHEKKENQKPEAPKPKTPARTVQTAQAAPKAEIKTKSAEASAAKKAEPPADEPETLKPEAPAEKKAPAQRQQRTAAPQKNYPAPKHNNKKKNKRKK